MPLTAHTPLHPTIHPGRHIALGNCAEVLTCPVPDSGAVFTLIAHIRAGAHAPVLISNPNQARLLVKMVSEHRARRRHRSPDEQEIVINVYKYVRRTFPEARGSVAECSEKTAEITGLMKQAVYRILKERKARRRSILEIVDPATLLAIRRKIYRFYHDSGYGVPRPENILCVVNADPALPNYTMPVFRRVLEHLQYRHVTQSRDDGNGRCETFSIPVV